jgi:hypothetical protein
VSVSGTKIIVENDEQYGLKLQLQDAKVDYAFNPSTPMPENFKQAMHVEQPAQADFDSDDIPF